jgi:hypothetical protein
LTRLGVYAGGQGGVAGGLALGRWVPHMQGEPARRRVVNDRRICRIWEEIEILVAALFW